jgi:hypothetical protein
MCLLFAPFRMAFCFLFCCLTPNLHCSLFPLFDALQLYLDGVQVGPSLVSPVTGNNGYWVASSSYGEDLLPSPVIDSMKICSYHSGAVSFIDFIIYKEYIQ